MQNLRYFTHNNFAAVLHKYRYQLNIGDITAGTIFSKEKKGFLVDIGEPIAGYLPKDEININKYKKTTPIINNSREFFILAYNKKSKQLILSIKRLEYIRAWQRIKQIKQEDLIMNLHIHTLNRGGLLTTIEGLQSFIPNSHISNIPKKESLINTTIKSQILFIDEKNNKIICSHKRAILNSLLPNIYIGKIIIGIITKIYKYGLFININGFLALLHISELRDENLHNSHIFYIGNSISVQIIHIDTKQGRLSLSRRHIS